MVKKFLSKLNIRQLIIHFIAFWLLIYGIHTLASLYDFKFLYSDFALKQQGEFLQRFNNDLFIIYQSGNLGIIIAYIISYRLSVKRNWYWINSIMVFIVVFALYFIDHLGWEHLKATFLYPGRAIFGDDSLAAVIINGLIMLAAGFFLLLKKQIIDFIDRGVTREKKAPQPRVPKAATRKQ
jgi:hypothetical protein